MKKVIANAIIIFTVLATYSHGVEPKKVLVVISSESALTLKDGKRYPTGYFLNEFTVPVMALVNAGYQIVVANPKGNKATLDHVSDQVSFFHNDPEQYKKVKSFHDAFKPLQQPERLAEVIKQGLDSYQAVFFPGGHAPMEDLLHDKDVAKVLQHFHQSRKPTALICHAPISLLATKDSKKNWPYRGYKMTVFSTTEEKAAEGQQLGGKVILYPQVALTSAGGRVAVGKEWQSHVVQDRELITGQNPASDEELVKVLLQALSEKS